MIDCRSVIVGACAVGLLVGSGAALAKGPADYEMILQRTADRGMDEKRWAEIGRALPAAPKAENLVPIYVGPMTENSFAVDRESVTVSPDGVVRYTLVVTSSAGARNVSFEGLRCETAERRLYAFGRSDGSWSKARNNQWAKIQDNTLNRHHAALYKEYFCTTGGLVLSTEEARRALPQGNPAATPR